MNSGSITKYTPKKPTAIAKNLLNPTFSLIIRIEKIVTKKGLTKNKVTAKGSESLESEK